ncbi:histidine protein methyltransferase 1 homolog [Heptranchias perlo]|uniref:histidine protein methyltransferase 1 homolog n=1 Tax=Heptranchias perlo TaxID=212740 RepID=UPI0035593AE0
MEFKFEFSVAAGRPEATGNGAAAAEQPVPRSPPASGKEGRVELGGRSPSPAAELGVPCPGPGLREHPVPWGELDQLLDDKIVEVLELGSSPAIKIKHVNVAVVETALSRGEGEGEGEGGVSGAISTHSDLIPGVYEGGLKIWECTFDLLKHLDGVDLRSQRVLDLGCGAGLLGILALRKQAQEVHFQDYNGAVIEEITIPNVALSEEESESSLGGKEEPGLEDEDDDDDDPPEKRRKGEESSPPPKRGMLSRCRFFSGEWSQFSKVHGSNGSFKYDVILTSETLYNPDCYGALHDTFLNLLSEKGTVYLASKTHYFGVGGGIHLFESFVRENKVFEIKTVKVIDDGLQRCIAAMSFRRVKCS